MNQPLKFEDHEAGGAPRTNDNGQRLLALWDGGYASCPVPEQGRIVIGRSETVDLCVSSNVVSREHAIVTAGEPPMIQDLWSTNGTRVDGRRIAAAETAPLVLGRVIELGNALLILQDGMSPAPTPHFGARLPDGLTVPPSEANLDRLHRLIDLAATVSLNVTLQGDPNLSTELMAKRIHQRSLRGHNRFVKVSCAELRADELGRLLREVRGGTLLLDEVAALSLDVQANLLDRLGPPEAPGVGHAGASTLDVRFIATTSADLSELVALGGFHAELLQWLGGIRIPVPSV
jgi:pSer/pThr/pTyr-binding forkhead associated (FHA) protein